MIDDKDVLLTAISVRTRPLVIEGDCFLSEKNILTAALWKYKCFDDKGRL